MLRDDQPDDAAKHICYTDRHPFNVPLIKPTLCTTVQCTAAHGTEQQVAALHTGDTPATRGTPETSKETNVIASAVADAAVQQAAESLVRDHSLTAGTR